MVIILFYFKTNNPKSNNKIFNQYAKRVFCIKWKVIRGYYLYCRLRNNCFVAIYFYFPLLIIYLNGCQCYAYIGKCNTPYNIKLFISYPTHTNNLPFHIEFLWTSETCGTRECFLFQKKIWRVLLPFIDGQNDQIFTHI